jgi:homoserine O-acetyltransferase/O-succinyltransferase
LETRNLPPGDSANLCRIPGLLPLPVMSRSPFIVHALSVFLLVSVASGQEQQFASLGDIKLQSGATLRDCRIGYRTYGTLNADKSNAILFPTWAGGTTEQLQDAIVKDKFADPERYFVITVDALSNGVSSSPSNSRPQPRMKFPRITIRDMVETQHELLAQVFGIHHLKAVMGISMGGMQTFQWIVAYPDFMDKAIPIVGSPRLAPYDLVLWQTQIDAIMNDPAWKKGNYKKNPARTAELQFGDLFLSSPEHFNQTATREQVIQAMAQAPVKNEGSDANNKIRQSQAMMALDVSQAFGGSMQRAAEAVKAKVLVVSSKNDLTVTPQPAIDFAHLLNAKLLVLDDDCGHSAPGCESKMLVPAIAAFLAQP